MYRRLTPLDGEAVLPLAEAKAQSEVEASDTSHDSNIRAFRNASIAHVERVTGLILSPGQFEWEGASFPRDLPVRPINSVDSVSYTGSDGVSATYTGARLANAGLLPAFGSTWPRAYGSVKVTFTAGVTDLSQYSDVVLAIRMLTAHSFANREAVSERQMHEMPMAVTSLLRPHMLVIV